MRITLEVVRKVLRRGLGQQCFTAGFIREVLEDPHHASASITQEGVLRYGPTFVERHLTCPEDLFCLLLHELLHPLWAHFIHSSGKLQNIAADAVINAAITTLYADRSGEGHLFRSFYQPEGLEGLLRPDSQMKGHPLERVYHRLYPQQLPHPSHGRSSGAYPLTTGELIRALRILLDEEEVGQIRLLGSHSEGTLNQRGERDQDAPLGSRPPLPDRQGSRGCAL